MVPLTRRDALKALPALAAGLGGCSGVTGDDASLPVPTTWRVGVDEPTPVVRPADGPLLVGSRSPFTDHPVLSGRDPATGEEQWSVTGEKGRKSPIGVDDTNAYVFTKGEEVFAVEYQRGTVEWQRRIAPVDEADPGVVQFAPIPVGDRVVVPISGTEDDVPDRLVVFDCRSGDHLSEHELESSLAGKPATDGASVLVPLLDGSLDRTLTYGTPGWRYDFDVPLSDVTIRDGTAYAGSPKEEIQAFDVRTGKMVWQGPVANTVLTPPLVGDDTVYVGGADYYLSAFDRASGDRRWRSELANAVTHGPMMIDDKLVTLAGGNTRHRGPGGTVPFDPTVLYVHDTAGELVNEYRFEGYLQGGEVIWAGTTTEGIYLGQKWQLSRLSREVLDAE